MHSSRVPERDAKAVAKAFLGMRDDAKGRAVLEQAARLAGMDGAAYFMASDGSEYAPYRDFYRNAPAQLR
jgi:phosphonate transport system substrate-binding protein